MRFGKTFSSYQLAKKLNAKRVLAVTFKPAVEDAWQTDLESHVAFEGWQYMSRAAGGNPSKVKNTTPLVYFGSLQDLLGKDANGNGNRPLEPKAREVEFFPMKEVLHEEVKIH